MANLPTATINWEAQGPVEVIELTLPERLDSETTVDAADFIRLNDSVELGDVFDYDAEVWS